MWGLVRSGGWVGVLDGVVAVVVVVLVVVSDPLGVVRLTNSGAGGSTVSEAAVVEPPPLAVSPTVPSTVETSCGPGRKTTSQSERIPVGLSPCDSWSNSTPSVVASCHSSSTTMPLALNPSAARLRLSSRMSEPSVSAADRVR